MRTTLQRRLMSTFVLVIAVLAGSGFLLLAYSRTIAAADQSRVLSMVQVAELTQATDQGVVVLGRMATGPSPEQADADLVAMRDRINQLRQGLPSQAASPESARMLVDLDAMADSFVVEAGAALYAFHAGNLDLYFQHDSEATQIAGYIRETADRFLDSELEAYRQVYPQVSRTERLIQQVDLATLVLVALLAVLFGWSFSRSVTDPLRLLATAATRIAGGDLSGPGVTVGTGDEMAVVSQTFNRMQLSLRSQVAELEEKADLQSRLQAEQLENLQVHSLLREAELRALQSQVNPHFLFNTLNVVAKTALIEGADRTCTLLETVSDLLRYSLRQLDRPVTLGEEVAQVRRYAAIQWERFRDRMRFEAEIDESAMHLAIPCLTLQPLVENGFIRGIGAREEGGTVRLVIRRQGEHVRIIVADDGVGIPPDRLALLTGGSSAATEPQGHTTGLGVMNVRRRLELFYSQPVSFEIESQVGWGTTVTIELPDGAQEVEAT